MKRRHQLWQAVSRPRSARRMRAHLHWRRDAADCDTVAMQERVTVDDAGVQPAERPEGRAKPALSRRGPEDWRVALPKGTLTSPAAVGLFHVEPGIGEVERLPQAARGVLPDGDELKTTGTLPGLAKFTTANRHIDLWDAGAQLAVSPSISAILSMIRGHPQRV